MNKKIILSLGLLVFVGAVVASGTGAFFTDTETSAGNTFAAGSVDVTVGQFGHNYTGGGQTGDQPNFSTTNGGTTFRLEDLKPLDTGEITYQADNNANPAYICTTVEASGNAENNRLDPEVDAGDNTPNIGELQDFLSFKFGNATGSLTDIAGTSYFGTNNGVATGGSESGIIEYCFGDYDSNGDCQLSSDDDNVAQTDSVDVDLTFQAIQTRNNDGFSCDQIGNGGGGQSGDQTITEDDLYTGPNEGVSNDWYFYNDSNDTVMDIDEFSGQDGENHMDTIDGVAGAKMLLHDSEARYNIASDQFKNTPLSSISSLKYRIYDASETSGEVPYMHFNVDFDGNNNFQGRLVHVPGNSTNAPLAGDTWTEFDAINGPNDMWNWSSGNSSQWWPAGSDSTGNNFDSSQKYNAWDDIVAAYSGIKTLDLYGFLGVRVGHPGPDGEEGYVDYIEFDGTKYDFEN